MTLEQKTASIIQGTSGSGKSTFAKKIAAEHNALYIEHDYFMFAIQPYRPETEEHYNLGNLLLQACFAGALKSGKSLVLEGVMTTHGALEHDFYLDEYIAQLESSNYKVVRVMFHTSYEIAKVRMQPRATWESHVSVVSENLFKKIESTLFASVPDSVPRFDTAQMSTEEINNEIVRLL
jgi:predicted ABC-type ATPase